MGTKIKGWMKRYSECKSLEEVIKASRNDEPNASKVTAPRPFEERTPEGMTLGYEELSARYLEGLRNIQNLKRKLGRRDMLISLLKRKLEEAGK